mmetsp:Transcript_83601/g.240232  ORF Transcript_83601/g.240232 Transcript_83601/m.240232 type:complete len:324 (+) Transcript_83601:713-1684(+)
MAGLLNEAPDLRQLVQASSRACLDLGRPCSLCHHAIFATLVQALLQEVPEVLALPSAHVRAHHAARLPVRALELDGRPSALLVLHLQAQEARGLALDEVMQILVAILHRGVHDKRGLLEALDLGSTVAASGALREQGLAGNASLVEPLLQELASAASEPRGVEALKSASGGVLGIPARLLHDLSCRTPNSSLGIRGARSLVLLGAFLHRTDDLGVVAGGALWVDVEVDRPVGLEATFRVARHLVCQGVIDAHPLRNNLASLLLQDASEPLRALHRARPAQGQVARRRLLPGGRGEEGTGEGEAAVEASWPPPPGRHGPPGPAA